MSSSTSTNQQKITAEAEIFETNYPVINVNQALWNPLLTKFRRAIAPINPFATQQVPSHDRIAMGARWGNQFYVPDPYPNGATFYRFLFFSIINNK